MYHVDQSAAKTVSHLSDLRSALDGELHLPGDPGWDDVRRAWQLTVDQRPSAVVIAGSVADIEVTVRAALRLGLRVAPQATGHGAGAIVSLRNAILLRTDRLNEVSVDATRMTARAEAGAQWKDVVGLAAEHGLAAASGSSPDVGVVGYTLGGGLGWIGRSHGLAANSVLAIELVDATGVLRRVDAQHDEDLFWAARGGVVTGVVTAIEFRLYPIPELCAGSLMWPIDRAADVVDRWREWIADVPVSVTSLARVLRYPALPELPPFLQNRSFVAVEAAIQEDAEAAAKLLAPLRALEPEIDTMRMMPPSELGSVHGDPPNPVPAYGDAIMLAELSAEAVDAFVSSAIADESAPLLSVELRHLGGELAPARGEGGAVAGLAGEGIVYIVGIAPVPDAAAAVAAAADRVVAALRPWQSARAYRNFAERPTSADALYGDAAPRLRRIVAQWDPDSVFCTAHALR